MSSVVSKLATEIDDLLADAVRRKVAPGLVAVVTDRTGTIYEGAAGRLAIDQDGDAAVDTLFRAASMTKPLTTVAALQLVEAGRLSLDDEVASILPAFGELPVLHGFDQAVARLRPAQTAATIRHLMTHTSGHGYWWGNADLARYRELTGLVDILSGRLAALHAPLIAEPGSRWEYGISTDWLGRVIETVSGQDLAAYLAEHVLAPLNMLDTTFVPTDEAPSLLNDVVALPFRQSWGFGFQLMQEDIPGMRRAGTGFWSGILNTYFWVDRRSGLAATIMTQLLPLFDGAMLATVAAFESAVYASTGPDDRPE